MLAPRLHARIRSAGSARKTEQIRNDVPSVADDECGVAELMDQENVVEMTGIASVPELGQRRENLVVVLHRTIGYFDWLGHGRLPAWRAWRIGSDASAARRSWIVSRG